MLRISTIVLLIPAVVSVVALVVIVLSSAVTAIRLSYRADMDTKPPKS